MNFKLISTIIAVAAAISGCGSAITENAANTPARSTANATESSQSAVNAPAPQNSQELKKAEEFSAKAFNASGDNSAPVVSDPSRDVHKSAVYGRSAPDNSTFATTMNAKGQPVETRTFQNHPQLIKVERVFVSPSQKIIKVYLKNGKVVETTDEKVPNFAAASPGNILVEAGVNEPPKTVAADARKQGIVESKKQPQ